MEFLIAVVVIMAIILLSCINVVPQARAYVIERLGGYQGTGGRFPTTAGYNKR